VPVMGCQPVPPDPKRTRPSGRWPRRGGQTKAIRRRIPGPKSSPYFGGRAELKVRTRIGMVSPEFCVRNRAETLPRAACLRNEAARLMADVAEALHHAHDKGLVHRDRGHHRDGAGCQRLSTRPRCMGLERPPPQIGRSRRTASILSPGASPDPAITSRGPGSAHPEGRRSGPRWARKPSHLSGHCPISGCPDPPKEFAHSERSTGFSRPGG